MLYIHYTVFSYPPKLTFKRQLKASFEPALLHRICQFQHHTLKVGKLKKKKKLKTPLKNERCYQEYF